MSIFYPFFLLVMFRSCLHVLHCPKPQFCSLQNHNYAVDPESLPEGVKVTHINLNDNSCAGLQYPKMKLMSLQYHPESSPGPHDSDTGTFLDSSICTTCCGVTAVLVWLSWCYGSSFVLCSLRWIYRAHEEQQIVRRVEVHETVNNYSGAPLHRSQKNLLYL